MELVKLPIYLGLEVEKILSAKGYKSRKNSMGLLSLEFTMEELDEIEELEIINPSHNCLDGIENLHNLKKLNISTKGSTSYKLHNASITDKDIKKISGLISLTSLTIDNQSDITWVYLDKLINLEEINVTRNTRVDEVSGLDKLKYVREISAYGNKQLYKLDGITDLINANELEILELDLLNYPEVASLKGRLMNIVNCRFVETLRNGKDISYTTGQISLFHNRCLKILEEANILSLSKRMQVIGIEKYLAENITYDYDALNNKERVHIENGNRKGKNNGTNSAYNGIMFSSCVCEGYTRSMQYLLKLIGIKTEDVYCISGANKINVRENYHDLVDLPDNGYHSIIRIDDLDYLYCDPCWDSCRWQKGDTSLPYCLLTKEEISKDHTLSFEENDIDNNTLRVPREEIEYALKKLSDNSKSNNDLNQPTNHFH